MSNAFTAKLGAKLAANTPPAAAPVAASVMAAPASPVPTPVAAAPTPMPVAAPAPPPAPVAAAPATPVANAPPWANPSCTACKGQGFNSQGSPCRICDAKAADLGKPPSSSFDISAANGSLKWAEKGTGDVAGVSPSASTPAPVAQAQAVEAAPAPVATPDPAPAAPAAPIVPVAAAAPATAPAPLASVPASVSAPVAATAAKDSRGGRPKKGFIFCVNCAPLSGDGRKGSGRGVFHLSHVLKEIMESMALQSGVLSFYDLDVWDRRAKLAQTAPALAEQFGTDIVIATGVSGESDLKALVDALRMYAGMEIGSVG